MVLVGLPAESLPIPIFELVLNGISVIGSVVGTRQDLKETLDLAAGGLVTSTYTRAPMQVVNDVFRRMRDGTISGRVVLDIAKGHRQMGSAAVAAYAGVA